MWSGTGLRWPYSSRVWILPSSRSGLGHESIETTNAYVLANLAMKEKALGKNRPMDTPFRRFHANDRLLAFLESI
jgi:hypothetical protein